MFAIFSFNNMRSISEAGTKVENARIVYKIYISDSCETCDWKHYKSSAI